MALLLAIESSTKNCSVAIGNQDEVLASRSEWSDQYVHSEKLHLFIKECLEEARVDVKDIEGIAVGKGPGSYTGLRIGTSAAKGFCFALKIPLIAINSLELLSYALLEETKVNEDEFIIPMIDARRMEVYCGIYNNRGEALTEVEAKVIDENSFKDIDAEKLWLIGDGAEKTSAILKNSKFHRASVIYPNARVLLKIASAKFSNNNFEDVAYFEPFYLKDFIAGKPKKLL